MNRTRIGLCALGLTCLGASLIGVAQPRVLTGRAAIRASTAPVRLTGKVLGFAPRNGVVIRAADGRDYTIHYPATATYRLGGQTVLYSQLPPSTQVELQYTVDGDRHVLWVPQDAPAAVATLQGRLSFSSTHPPAIMLTADDGQQYRLYLNEKDRFNAQVETTDGRSVVRTLAPAAISVARTPANSIQGRVVTIAPDHFVVATATGETVTIYSDPSTVYRFNNVNGTFADLREGVDVTVDVAMTGARRIARMVANSLR